MNRCKLPLLLLPLAIFGVGYFSDTWLGSPAAVPAGPAEKQRHDGAGQKATDAADSTEIPQKAANAAGIKTETAGGATVHETITLTGRITLNQNTTAQVKARFPGIVRKVTKGQGEMVEVGDELASVESNDSLQVYPVKAPISGVILSRNTNVGDVAGDAPLFSIADVSNVWAEFHVFPRDVDRTKNGQTIRVTSFEGRHAGEAPISVVLPVAESSSQTVVARVTLPNAEGLWHSGMIVRGDVVVDDKSVPLAVKTSAIQRMEGKAVVFVRNGSVYVMRPVTLGQGDQEWTEIKSGLSAGEVYVTENSFVVKADIGKAGAEQEE